MMWSRDEIKRRRAEREESNRRFRERIERMKAERDAERRRPQPRRRFFLFD
jgi:hypothetical protein